MLGRDWQEKPYGSECVVFYPPDALSAVNSGKSHFLDGTKLDWDDFVSTSSGAGDVRAQCNLALQRYRERQAKAEPTCALCSHPVGEHRELTSMAWPEDIRGAYVCAGCMTGPPNYEAAIADIRARRQTNPQASAGHRAVVAGSAAPVTCDDCGAPVPEPDDTEDGVLCVYCAHRYQDDACERDEIAPLSLDGRIASARATIAAERETPRGKWDWPVDHEEEP
jgi:hypothetical protein